MEMVKTVMKVIGIVAKIAVGVILMGAFNTLVIGLLFPDDESVDEE